MYFVKEGMSSEISHTVYQDAHHCQTSSISQSQLHWTKQKFNTELFPQLSFFKMTYKLPLKKLWTENWEVKAAKLP